MFNTCQFCTWALCFWVKRYKISELFLIRRFFSADPTVYIFTKVRMSIWRILRPISWKSYDFLLNQACRKRWWHSILKKKAFDKLKIRHLGKFILWNWQRHEQFASLNETFVAFLNHTVPIELNHGESFPLTAGPVGSFFSCRRLFFFIGLNYVTLSYNTCVNQ